MATESSHQAVSAVLTGRVRTRQTAHEFVRDTLRRSILSGELAGGTRLVQAELAEALEVSTTPIREALRDLASEGLVQLDAHRGGIVPELRRDELLEIYNIRMIIEPEAIRRATERISDDAISRIAELHDRMQNSESAADFITLNREFHLSIYDAVGSSRLLGILQGLLDASAMYVSASIRARPELQIEANADHVDILAALEARDPDRAAKAVIAHMRIPQEVFDMGEG